MWRWVLHLSAVDLWCVERIATSFLVTVRTLGAGGVVAATIAGQLAVSVVVDHFGLIGVAKQPVTAAKVVGVALLGLGTYLVVRE